MYDYVTAVFSGHDCDSDDEKCVFNFYNALQFALNAYGKIITIILVLMIPVGIFY